jgi:hypothetical protein
MDKAPNQVVKMLDRALIIGITALDFRLYLQKLSSVLS